MKLPKILIENDVFWEDENNKRANAIAAAKFFDVYEVDHFTSRKSNKGDIGDLTGETPYKSFDFYRGSFGLRSQLYPLNSKTRESLDIFNCLNWVPALSEFYVNKDYAFLDAKKITQEFHNGKLYAPIYIRPCKGNKIFSGQRLDTITKWLNEFRFFTENMNHSPYEICLLASPKSIKSEWRLVFVDNEYISGAKYLENGERVDEPITQNVIEYGQKVAQDQYFLNLPNFVLDICLSDSSLFMLEINSIYTSSYYSSDLNLIYQALRKYHDTNQV